MGKNTGKRTNKKANSAAPIYDDRGKKTVTDNDAFNAYYQAQEILSPTQWTQFKDYLIKPLPVSFRFTGNRSYATELKDFMKATIFPKLINLEIDGVVIAPPQSIDWYPNEACWVFDCPRPLLRRNQDAKEFQQFLMSETEVGNISRQELVSMIPVRLLDVQPGHCVLDTCIICF